MPRRAHSCLGLDGTQDAQMNVRLHRNMHPIRTMGVQQLPSGWTLAPPGRFGACRAD